MPAPAVTPPPTPPEVGAPTIDDRFYMIALMFQRTRQLQQGARPRVYKDGHKPTRLAQLEVMAGLISWEIGPDPTAGQVGG
jgi:DNA-directed RNA polymerase subunit K/omega